MRLQAGDAYANQPRIALWNLTRLAECLLPLFSDEQDKALSEAQSALSNFAEAFNTAYQAGLRGKLGLFTAREGDPARIRRLAIGWPFPGSGQALGKSDRFHISIYSEQIAHRSVVSRGRLVGQLYQRGLRFGDAAPCAVLPDDNPLVKNAAGYLRKAGHAFGPPFRVS